MFGLCGEKAGITKPLGLNGLMVRGWALMRKLPVRPPVVFRVIIVCGFNKVDSVFFP
jgi:hypothetical protein